MCMSFWAANIETRGRIFRGVAALIMLGAAFFLHHEGVAFWPWLLAIAGAFTLYEALRGWCILRACKIKTRF
jgi:hypothetical protein